MKKKSIAARLGVAALALTLVTTSLSSGTLAKYTTTFGVDAGLTIANWKPGASVTYTEVKDDSGRSETVTKQMMVSGFNTVTLANTANGYVKGVSRGMLAPGMNGQFTIDITSALDGKATDVDLKYSVFIKVKSGSVPKHFKMWQDDQEDTPIDFTVVLSPGELGLPLGTEQTIPAGSLGANAKRRIVVHWDWPYDQGVSDATYDSVDVGDGNGSSTEFEIYVQTVQATPEIIPAKVTPTPTPST